MSKKDSVSEAEAAAFKTMMASSRVMELLGQACTTMDQSKSDGPLTPEAAANVAAAKGLLALALVFDAMTANMVVIGHQMERLANAAEKANG